MRAADRLCKGSTRRWRRTPKQQIRPSAPYERTRRPLDLLRTSTSYLKHAVNYRKRAATATPASAYLQTSPTVCRGSGATVAVDAGRTLAAALTAGVARRKSGKATMITSQHTRRNSAARVSTAPSERQRSEKKVRNVFNLPNRSDTRQVESVFIPSSTGQTIFANKHSPRVAYSAENKRQQRTTKPTSCIREKTMTRYMHT